MSVLLVGAVTNLVVVLVYILLSKKLDKLGDSVVSAREDVAALAAQAAKSKTEIVGKIGSLNDAVAALEARIVEGTVTAEDLQPLKDEIQSLDDIVPDPVVEPPVEEPPVEPPVVEPPAEEPAPEA